MAFHVSTDNVLSAKGSHYGTCIGVFTSGGDAPGMNAAVRAVVRTGLYLGARVFFIREGYQGMIDGSEYIQEATWVSVSGIIEQGGTVIGSARSMEFKTREGRLKAAYNLVQNNICSLVVIGGDGSLTGANLFRQEWSSLLQELVTRKKISEIHSKQCAHLNIVGLVGSIDNDFCGTEMTIGTNSALHRIFEAIDSIVTTASSHQRAFILEVMGRHCGYLAVVTGLASEADYIFIPESPPDVDWPDRLCEKISMERLAGKRLNIIIIAEGAIDRKGNHISAESVKKIIIERLHHDTRITVLGHVQRGGNPSAFDRILASRMGVEAVLALLEATPDSEPVVVTLHKNHSIRVPLMQCVKNTQSVAEAMAKKNWEEAINLRGRSFLNNWNTYKMLSSSKLPKDTLELAKGTYKLAVMNVGAPCCGINAAVRSFVRYAICHGHIVLGINDGFEGLVEGKVTEMKWAQVSGWVGQGGAHLGTKRALPFLLMDKVAARFKEFGIQALVIIGGFEGYHALLQLVDAQKAYPELCIPMVIVPATISNNVPGTDFSIGTDTALNEITNICDRIRQSAEGTKKRVFIVEVMGGYCGYLATMASLAGAADATYIYEEPFNIKDLIGDVYHMQYKMAEGISYKGLILRNEKANKNYTTDFIYRLLAEEGKHLFSVRQNIPGHMQQGGSPSPYDRNYGTKLGAKAAHFVIEQLNTHKKSFSSDSVVLLGLIDSRYSFTPVLELKDQTFFEHRLPKKQWWMRLIQLCKLLGYLSLH